MLASPRGEAGRRRCVFQRAPDNDPSVAPESAEVVLPAGVPAWITPELIRLTINVWQPRYAEPLSVDDAVTIIQNAGRLMGALVLEG
jgi:hypothetical protein